MKQRPNRAASILSTFDVFLSDLKQQRAFNPMLFQLSKVIIENFVVKPDSRCIVFAKTRTIALGLVEYLKEEKMLNSCQLSPKFLTGAGARGEIGGELSWHGVESKWFVCQF